jgi:hypothetical protein
MAGIPSARCGVTAPDEPASEQGVAAELPVGAEGAEGTGEGAAGNPSHPAAVPELGEVGDVDENLRGGEAELHHGE